MVLPMMRRMAVNRVRERGSALRRWGRLLVLLLFASSILGQAHAFVAHSDTAGTAAISAADPDHLCDGHPGAAGHHCHSAGAVCPFCAPMVTSGSDAIRRVVAMNLPTEQIAVGSVGERLFRPPRLALQV